MPIKKPKTEAELKELHLILRRDPEHYLQIANQWLTENPNNAHALVQRRLAWMRLEESRKALEDVNVAVELDPNPFSYFSCAEVFKHLGEYQNALDDFAASEALIPEEWNDLGFGLLQQADCHARLGDEANALACCERLSDDFWTPGLNEAPAGDKIAIPARLRLVAKEANNLLRLAREG